jgi:hypothetical protein
LAKIDKLIDTTAETPADSFVLMRDYADCVRCKPLISLDQLKKGFNKELPEFVRKLKINKTQYRRVCEILHLYYIQTECPEEKPKFEAALKKRLETPFKRTKQDMEKLGAVVSEDEAAVILSDDLQQKQQLDAMFENTLQVYGMGKLIST